MTDPMDDGEPMSPEEWAEHMRRTRENVKKRKDARTSASTGAADT